MAKASYWQKGEAIDYKNETDKKIEAGTVVVFGNRIGVAGTEILPGQLGSLHVEGVFRMKKDSGAIVAGAEVYLDISTESITGTKPIEGESRPEEEETVESEAEGAGVKAGFAVEAAEAGADFVLVKINA